MTTSAYAYSGVEVRCGDEPRVYAHEPDEYVIDLESAHIVLTEADARILGGRLIDALLAAHPAADSAFLDTLAIGQAIATARQ